MAIYFISDPHFGHKGIIKYSNRPFENVEDMNKTLITNWNARVKPKDTLYILGDVCFGYSDKESEQLLKSLNGVKHLITGNHDRSYLKYPEFKNCFASIQDTLTITMAPYRVVMNHYPIAEWDGFFRGNHHIYGHIHDKVNTVAPYMAQFETALNASVEVIGYQPVTIHELISYNNIWKQNVLLKL